MQAPTLRARTPGELLDAAFQLMRSHYSAVLLGALAFQLPPQVLGWVFPGAAPLAAFLSGILGMAASGMIALVVSDVYLGNDVDLGRSLGAVGRRFFSLWGAGIMQGILLVLGFLLLVVPAFYVLAITFAMPAVVMLEEATASDSYTRSRELAKGYVGHILSTVGVAYVILWAGAFGIAFTAGIGIAAAGAPDAVAEPLGQLIYMALYPFVGVVTTLLYFDLRIRKEALDLQLLAQAIPGEPAPRPTGA